MTADSRPPAKRWILAALTALGAVLLLANLTACGGETQRKTSQGSRGPAPPPSSSSTEPPDEGGPPSSERRRGNDLDPRFRTCAEANAAGYGPYVKGTDPEYAWYQDRDGDGIDCEFAHGGGPSSPAPTPSPTEEPSTSEEPSAPTEEPSDSGSSLEPAPSDEPSEQTTPGDESSEPGPSEEPSAPGSSGGQP